VDALSLVGTNNYISGTPIRSAPVTPVKPVNLLEGSTGLDKEDRVCVTSFGLVGASARPPVKPHVSAWVTNCQIYAYTSQTIS
jgi:hypothetical protein